MVDRLCPDCLLTLASLDFRGIKVDACKNCGGMFFDDGELTQVKQSGDGAFLELESKIQPEFHTVEQTEFIKACPACQVPMTRYRYLYDSPVVLDECLTCGGLWVQEGDLRQMQEVLNEISAEEADVLTEIPHCQNKLTMRLSLMRRFQGAPASN